MGMHLDADIFLTNKFGNNFRLYINKMTEDIFTRFQSEEEEEPLPRQHQRFRQAESRYLQSDEKQRFIDPPRQLPKRSYSLEPDMVNGWKPKKGNKINLNNVFSINYDQYVVDQIVKELHKSKKKYKQTLVYLGPRRNNSYIAHQANTYQNPYPLDKKLDQIFSARNGLALNAKPLDSCLKFESDFEGGNLDIVVQRSSHEFDLFMRVDTNTRGHTNWFYFQISNGDFIGTVQFNICNFRREKSLYQRGLKPYVYSKLQHSQWQQGGKNIKYQKSKLKYQCIDQDYDEDFFYIEDQTHI